MTACGAGCFEIFAAEGTVGVFVSSLCTAVEAASPFDVEDFGIFSGAVFGVVLLYFVNDDAKDDQKEKYSQNI